VLIVSRIFGGVKLGVGGVSRAFRAAGEGAVASRS
jgi:putative IMPACT (imprinted ancient) family translation regulator